jgi:hypothetical protein
MLGRNQLPAVPIERGSALDEEMSSAVFGGFRPLWEATQLGSRGC